MTDELIEFAARIMNGNMYIKYLKNDPVITDGDTYFDNRAGFIFRKDSPWYEFLQSWWYNTPTPSFTFDCSFDDDRIKYKITNPLIQKDICAIVSKDSDSLFINGSEVDKPPRPPIKIKGLLSFAKLRRTPFGKTIMILPDDRKWKIEPLDKRFSLYTAKTDFGDIILRI